MVILVLFAVAVVLAFVITIIFEGLFSYTRQYLMTFLTSKIDARLASRVFRHLLSLPMFFFESTTAGISTIMLGCLASLMFTMVVAKRLDHWWKLVRRAAGYQQDRGAIEVIFAICVGVTLVAFTFWFLIIQGPGPSLAPTN